MDHSALSNRVKLSELCLPCEEERLYWGERLKTFLRSHAGHPLWRWLLTIQNILRLSHCKRYTYFLVGYTAVPDNFGVQ